MMKAFVYNLFKMEKAFSYRYRRMYMSVNRTREVVSSELGKEIEKDVFRLVASVEQRKNSESP